MNQRTRTFIVAAAALSTLAVLAGSAFGYTVFRRGNGNVTVWPTNTSVPWRLANNILGDVNETALLESLGKAFDAWEDVPCSGISFQYAGRTGVEPSQGLFIYFETSQWDPSADDVLAYGPSQSTSDGTIVAGQVIFNAVEHEWTTVPNVPPGKSDIQGVAAHEIGHTIGIGHSREVEATMFFTVANEPEDERTLEEDDRNAACFLYPTTPFNDGGACDACDDTSHCANGLCLSWPAEWGAHAYCGQDCSATSDCPAGFDCLLVDASVPKQCIPTTDRCDQSGGKQGLGGFCYGHRVCASNLCFARDGQAYCTRECGSGCPAGMVCGPSDVCQLAGAGDYGGSCTDDNECETALCIYFDLSSGTCTQTCGANGGSCPAADHQCYQGFCIPPGHKGNGAPCGNNAQCRGTYCTDNLCTQQCSGAKPCPSGTTCVGGFCQGAESGTACKIQSDCPVTLSCQEGVCIEPCDPIAAEACGAGLACRWAYDATTGAINGVCDPGTGNGPGQGCHSLTNPCRPDLVCALGGGTELTCHSDCRVQGASGVGCGAGETCESLDDSDDPWHGVCVEDAPNLPDVGPDEDIAPQPDVVIAPEIPVTSDVVIQTDHGPVAPDVPGTDAGDAVIAAPDSGSTVATDSGGGGTTGGDDGGCSGAPSAPGPVLPLALLLACGALIGLRRRRA